MNNEELNLKCNKNVEFYMIGIRKATKKNGITVCFACQSENCDLEYIWLKVTNILKLFKYKCVVTEVNRITPELYCNIFDVDIASAVYAVQ